MARIYISSTYSDLKEYRETVYRTLRQLRHDVIAMEDYVATDERPVDKCLRDVASCDIYVGIFAFRYGYIPTEQNPQQLSITELEYRKAGESGVARLVFLVKDGAAWSTALIDAMSDAQAARRIDALRSVLKQAHIDSFFESGEELARKVSVAVQQQLQLRPAERVQIDWDGPRRRLVDHMRRFAGARSEYDALKRYFPLTLQATALPATAQAPKVGSNDLPLGTWTDLIGYPCKVLLTGESGSGKTTLLLYEAQRLAEQAGDISSTPLPIFLSLRAFTGGDSNTLLEMAASENRIDANTLRALWSNPLRPMCLFLDGGDETAYREELIDAIIELAGVFTRVPGGATVLPPEVRSLVVACRPGPLQELMAKSEVSWNELLLMPLSVAAVDAMLTRFDATSLIPFLGERLRQTIRRPDLLSALAQSARERPIELLPRSASEIYGLYFSHVFNALGGQYDYERIQRPVIAHIAFEMVRRGQNAIACDDALYELMVTDLEALELRYHRRRPVLPRDWTAKELHDHLVSSPLVDVAAYRGLMMTFCKPIYRDYFVAVYLEMVGTASEEARELISGLTSGEQLQPLSFLLEIAPGAEKLFDVLPATALSTGVQIWLEDRGANTPVPASISAAFRERCAALQQDVTDLDKPVTRRAQPISADDPNPRRRFEAIASLASERPLPALPLLEAAEDKHPLIRAVAQHALLNAGDPCASLSFAADNGGIAWSSYGAGSARIGPLQLLRVPVPMMIALSISIDELDVDPFAVDAKFSFLPMSPSLFAANLFATTSVDWLDLLARFHEITVTSESLAQRVASRAGLAALASELHYRATTYAGVGALLAADLGLPWDAAPPVPADLNGSAAAVSYKDLRRLFSRANQGHTLRLSHLATDPVVNVSSSFNRIERGGKAVGLQVDCIELRGDDNTAEGTAQWTTVINGSQVVESVDGGTLRSIEVGVVRGFSRELPLHVHINDSMRIDSVVDGDIGAISINAFDGVACPLRLNASISIGRFIRSQFLGVGVGA